MKKGFILLIVIITGSTALGQKWDKEIICSTDTFVIEPFKNIKDYLIIQDTLQSYKIVKCATRSNVGIRFDVGVANYYYGQNTTSWIGQHGGPNFNFILALNKVNVGFRFKPWTIEPHKEMKFDGVILPTYAKLNSIKLDYYVGYSFDFKWLISMEPYVGYNRSIFKVINEDELKQTYSFAKTGGLIMGTTINKYFEIGKYEYLSVFGSIGYGFVDYSKVHPELDSGYLEWNLGISYKRYFNKYFSRKVE